MNLCQILMQCGLNACLFKNRERRRTMDSNLSADLSLTDLTIPASEYFPLNAVLREKRKRRMIGLATLKRKFVKKKKNLKSCNHGKVMREFVSNWSSSELCSLLEEYEALAALKDLTVQAELARPPAATYKQDLSKLYDLKYCTDVDLMFRGTCFPVHRVIVASRCSYFRNLLSNYPCYGVEVRVNLKNPKIDCDTFSALLRYIYTGDIGPAEGKVDINFLKKLGDELGILNTLEQDLRYLLESADYADTLLVFSDSTSIDYRTYPSYSDFGFQPRLEIGCHKALLSARSPFFRNLIQKRSRTGEEQTERILNIPSKIVLDENIIPKKYANILMHAIYLDAVDLSLIIRNIDNTASVEDLKLLEEVTKANPSKPSMLEEVMELYQIGRFLELEIVTQGCEDLILEWLSLDTLPSVLRWGSQPYGSAWVYRQAKQLMCEEFSQFTTHSVLTKLEKPYLIECLHSDFVQASELDILQVVIKWAENRLVKKLEEQREQNLITVHVAAARRGGRKKNLCDLELRDILCDLLPLVRVDHIIPSNSELLCQVIKKGLIGTPPSHMIATSHGHGHNRVHAWIRTEIGLFVKPRFFMPYYEEIKSIVEEHISKGADLLKVKKVHYVPDVADMTLHVIRRDHDPMYASCCNIIDVISTSSSNLPAIDGETLSAMIKREHKLKLAPSCQRALDMSRSSKHEIMKQIRLRVVREFNLPDSVTEVLENASSTCYCASRFTNEFLNTPPVLTSEDYLKPLRCISYKSKVNSTAIASSSTAATSNSNNDNESSKAASNQQQKTSTFPRLSTSYRLKKQTPSLAKEGISCVPEMTSSSCSERQLSDAVPDVAMSSTAMSLARLSLSSSNGSLSRLDRQQPEIELDMDEDGFTSSYSCNRRPLVPPHPFM